MFNACTGSKVCNGCGEAARDMISVDWASGDMHFCARCWPSRREFYEDESGRKVWERIGNRYTRYD
jgi:hypothetical protein